MGEYHSLKRYITAQIAEMDKLVKSHRMSQQHPQEVFHMYLDRHFSKFMSQLVKAHAQLSSTQLQDKDTSLAIDNLLQFQFDFSDSFTPVKQTKKDEESKRLYQNGVVQTLYDTQGWLVKVRQSMSDVSRELLQVGARQEQVVAVVEAAKKPDFKVTNTLLALIEEGLMETRRGLNSTEVLLRDRAHILENLVLKVDKNIT